MAGTTDLDGRRYHHGHLRTALLEAGLELTRQGGPSALGLRDVTRRVGVSPNAAYRHFADRQALLLSVSERIQVDMVARMRELGSGSTDDSDPAARALDRLRAVGLGYIEFALSEPGWFEVAFGEIDPAGLAGAESGETQLAPPLAMLVAALDEMVAVGSLTPERRVGAEWPCWSTVHGFALLALHGPLRALAADDLRSAAEGSVEMILSGLLGPDDRAPRH